jgi:oligopeptidase B
LATVVNPKKTRLSPPVAKIAPSNVYFGVNTRDPSQFRGNKAMNPPVAREDPYYWLRDTERKNPEVLGYIKEENAYTEESLSHLSDFREELYQEMLSHLQETDEEVPHRRGDYLYYSKTVKGLSYKIHCRRLAFGGPEEVILDENDVAKGHEYSDVGSWEPSPSHRLLAYGVDNSGYETYTIRVIRDISTKEHAADTIEGTSGQIVWAADDSSFFYLTLDDEHRPYKVFMHVMGTPQSQDVCLLTESDGRFWMDVSKTTDDRYLLVGAGSTETSEYYFIDLSGLSSAQQYQQELVNRMTCFQTRQQGLRYEDIDHQDGYFYIVTNKDDCINNKLVRVPVSAYTVGTKSTESNTFHTWQDLREYNASEQISSVLALRHHLVISGRAQGFSHIWIVPYTNEKHLGGWQPMTFPEQTYNVWLSDNYVYDTETVRIGYSSFITPRQVRDYNLYNGQVTVLKEQAVPGYDHSQYACRRMEVRSRDGTTCIPMSLVYHKSSLYSKSRFQMDEESGQLREDLSRPDNCLYQLPTLLYGYGSYGHPIDPTFDFKRLALLDRGVVFVIAHIRGGGEMGRSWYEKGGKYCHKMNTFHDFADCAKALISQQITTPDKLAIVGRSAGGLLIGATINMYPSLFKVAVADVPFVDVLNTMSDPSIPLTVTEWEEWGNPNEEEFFQYMKRYSPYDNIKKQRYPSLLVTAGLNDPRVPYWEAAKFVAKLRTHKLQDDSNPVYLKTDLSSGHFSASDRYKYIKETAFEYAFILDELRARECL